MKSAKIIAPLCDITLHKQHANSFDKITRSRNSAKSQLKENLVTAYSPVKINQVKRELESDDEVEEKELSAYEKMVQRNREEKMAFLQSIKMNEVKEEFREAVINVTHKPKVQKPKSFKKPKPAVLKPVRKSMRLAKLDIDLSEAALYQKALEIAEVEQEQKILPQLYEFEKAVDDKQDYVDFVNNFKFDDTDKKFNNEYSSHFKKMKLKESNIAKVVPARVTTLAVHPSTDNIIIVAGSKYGQLGFWNVTSDANPIVFAPHTEGITNVRINPYNYLQIVSSSYDGTMRCGDVEKKIFAEIYNVSEETCCTYFDFVSANTFLVSQKNGNVSVIDVRNESLKSEKKHDCHDYSIKTVSVHPINKSLFLTADTKGVLKLWDLRKLQKKPIISVSHHTRSVSSAFFSPATGRSILTTSSDDSLCLFDSSNVEKEILFNARVRHNNHTGRWLTPFKGTWLPNSDDTFVVGSMQYPRRIEIFNSFGNEIYNFKDENLSSVTSVNQFHPSLNVLAGANSSGKVFVFIDTELKF